MLGTWDGLGASERSARFRVSEAFEAEVAALLKEAAIRRSRNPLGYARTSSRRVSISPERRAAWNEAAKRLIAEMPKPPPLTIASLAAGGLFSIVLWLALVIPAWLISKG